MSSVRKLLFKSLSLENYLRVLQQSYFLFYKSGLLKLSTKYDYHYFAKKLIKKGDIIIDIGANMGYYSILFAKWTGKTGKVYSVEPIRIYNKVFNEKAKKYDNIVLYPYALGLEEKTVELVSSPHTGYLNTGLPHIYDSNQDGKIEDAEFRFEAEMKLPSRLFADLERIDYLKCDIEGFEYSVLSEMKHILEKRKPIIQVEIWKEKEKEVSGLLKSIGYIPHKLYKGKLTSDEEKIRNISGDFIFIHKDRQKETVLK